MAIKDLVTLGIGCSPGSIKFLLLTGLDIGAEVGFADVALANAAVTPLVLTDDAVTALALVDAVTTALAIGDATRS